jgi:hypothetical protein
MEESSRLMIVYSSRKAERPSVEITIKSNSKAKKNYQTSSLEEIPTDANKDLNAPSFTFPLGDENKSVNHLVPYFSRNRLD